MPDKQLEDAGRLVWMLRDLRRVPRQHWPHVLEVSGALPFEIRRWTLGDRRRSCQEDLAKGQLHRDGRVSGAFILLPPQAAEDATPKPKRKVLIR